MGKYAIGLSKEERISIYAFKQFLVRQSYEIYNI